MCGHPSARDGFAEIIRSLVFSVLDLVLVRGSTSPPPYRPGLYGQSAIADCGSKGSRRGLRLNRPANMLEAPDIGNEDGVVPMKQSQREANDAEVHPEERLSALRMVRAVAMSWGPITGRCTGWIASSGKASSRCRPESVRPTSTTLTCPESAHRNRRGSKISVASLPRPSTAITSSASGSIPLAPKTFPIL